MILFLSLLLGLSSTARSMPLYGADDRLDLYQVEDPQLRALADSTPGIFENKDLTPFPDGSRVRLSLRSYQEKNNLCADEPFAAQSIGPVCSAALVGPDLVLTAGHCVMTQFACDDASIVFGFSIPTPGADGPRDVPASDVYRCKRLLSSHLQGKHLDYAIFQLDRPVQGRRPLLLGTGGVRLGDRVFAIGYPAGLPAKIAGNAVVLKIGTGFFESNLDIFHRNSGSPVFSLETRRIVGLVTAGESDFIKRGNCFVSKLCEDADSDAKHGCFNAEAFDLSAAAPEIELFQDPSRRPSPGNPMPVPRSP